MLYLAIDQAVHGLRRVYMVSQKEREDRQLTSLRKTLGQRRTRTLNKIHRIINRHNLIWNYPTKTFQTQAGRRWLEKVKLPQIDRLEMNMLLEEWKTWDKQADLLPTPSATNDERTASNCTYPNLAAAVPE